MNDILAAYTVPTLWVRNIISDIQEQFGDIAFRWKQIYTHWSCDA